MNKNQAISLLIISTKYSNDIKKRKVTIKKKMK